MALQPVPLLPGRVVHVQPLGDPLAGARRERGAHGAPDGGARALGGRLVLQPPAHVVDHVHVGQVEALEPQPADAHGQVQVVEPHRRPARVVATGLQRGLAAVHHAAADSAVHLGGLLAGRAVAVAAAQHALVVGAPPGGLQDLGAAVVEALGPDHVDPARVQLAPVEHDLGGDHAHARVDLHQVDHALHPARRLDRRVGVQLDHELAGGGGQALVQCLDHAAGLLLDQPELAGEAPAVAPPPQDLAAAVGGPVVHHHQLEVVVAGVGGQALEHHLQDRRVVAVGHQQGHARGHRASRSLDSSRRPNSQARASTGRITAMMAASRLRSRTARAKPPKVVDSAQRSRLAWFTSGTDPG